MIVDAGAHRAVQRAERSAAVQRLAGEPRCVVLLEAPHRITELAQAIGTIPYEVLTSIAQRVKRVYVQG